MSRPQLVQQAVEAQREVLRELVTATLGEFLEVDLTMAQLKALSVIEGAPGCTIGNLSAQLGTKLPAASLLVDKLERDGLAYRRRDAADGRRVIVQVTAEGSRLVGRVRRGGHLLLASWVQQLPESDLAALARGALALAASVRESRLAADQEVPA